MVKVWVSKDTVKGGNLIKVEYRGETHSANMAEDRCNEEPTNSVGDMWLIMAASCAWQGEPYFEISEEALSKIGGGIWHPEEGPISQRWRRPGDKNPGNDDLV